MTKLIRVATVSSSLNMLLKGQLSYLSDYYKVIAVSGGGKDLYEVAEREQVEIYPINMERKISPLKDLISLWKLYNYFRKEKPAIVHSITPKAGLLSMLAAYFARVPIRMHTFTGLIFPTKTGLIKYILIYMDRLLCYSATHIYPEGEGVKKDLINFKITNKALNVLANGNVNGIDIEYFNSLALPPTADQKLKLELGIKETDFIYLFVGRLVGDKGINELVSSFRQVANEHLDAKLLLIGTYENDLDPLMPDTLKEIKENTRIIELGFQIDIRPYMHIADLFVFPSYREGFPNVLLQAGAMILPAIATDINGSNEIIRDGINGVIIPVKDSKELYSKMLYLYKNYNFLSVMKENCRAVIASNYTNDIVWAAQMDEYNTISRNVQKLL